MSKVTYVIIALLIAGGVWFMFQEEKAEAPAPTNETEVVDETESEMDSHDEMEDTVADDTAVHVGTDVGMEYPETPISDDEVAAKVFNLTGENFAFSTKEIRVQEGDTVIINFESTGGFHDWVIDEFGAATEKVREGEKTTVTFVADKAGTYEYYCSVGEHRAAGMVGKLIVE